MYILFYQGMFSKINAKKAPSPPIFQLHVPIVITDVMLSVTAIRFPAEQMCPVTP